MKLKRISALLLSAALMLSALAGCGTTVVVVTHNREIVNAMHKRVVTMKRGIIISDQEGGEYIDED